MKALILALTYNNSSDKSAALEFVKNSFVREFQYEVENFTTNSISEQAKIYRAFEIHWAAFCARTGETMDSFHIFMKAAYPFETERIQKYIGKENLVA